MALSTARIHRMRGRPPRLAAGIKSLIHSHSSSVRSLGYIFSFIYPFYATHEDFSDLTMECLDHYKPLEIERRRLSGTTGDVATVGKRDEHHEGNVSCVSLWGLLS